MLVKEQSHFQLPFRYPHIILVLDKAVSRTPQQAVEGIVF